jgi:hypothetical protein
VFAFVLSLNWLFWEKMGPEFWVVLGGEELSGPVSLQGKSRSFGDRGLFQYFRRLTATVAAGWGVDIHLPDSSARDVPIGGSGKSPGKPDISCFASGAVSDAIREVFCKLLFFDLLLAKLHLAAARPKKEKLDAKIAPNGL